MSGLRPIGKRDFDRVGQSATVPVLVQFWKPGCGHCRALSLELERVHHVAGGRVCILTINVDEHRQIAAALELTALPALALFEHGEFRRFIGGVGTKEEILKHVGLTPQ